MRTDDTLNEHNTEQAMQRRAITQRAIQRRAIRTMTRKATR